MTALEEVEGFETLDARGAARLVDARLTVHYAAQLASAAGTTLAPAADDFSHTALSWLYGQSALAGVALPDGRRVALRVRDLTLVVLGPATEVVAELSLSKKTMAEASTWLGETLGSEVAPPEHELPRHPLASGAAFEAPDDRALDALARWFGNAARLLGAISGVEWNASPVLCWPHHFDIATLISLDPDAADADEARSIGIGMTPGDGGHPAPYFYVTPWPYPSVDALPPLEGGGGWNTEGWVGARLNAEDLRADDASGQRAQLAAFIRSSVDAARALLA